MSYETKYNFVRSCGKHEREINGYPNVQDYFYDTWCNNIKSQYETYNITNYELTCRKVMYYLNFIPEQSGSIDNSNRCKYLYYWIHHDLLENNKEYSDSLELYRNFLGIYFQNDVDGDNDNHICKHYLNESENIILEKSAKLIELYNSFHNNSQEFNCTHAKTCSDLYINYVQQCNSNYDHDFCSELQNFKNKYDSKMASIAMCTDAPSVLPSAIKYDTHVFIIPVIILLIMAFILFIFYKFTPFGSRIIQRKLRKKVFLENQAQVIHNIPSTSETIRRKDRNIAYHIPYNSAKY